jgi:hypothetical protein
VTLALPTHESADFSLTVTEDGPAVSVRMRGNGGMKAQHVLEPFLTALHQQVLQTGAREVTMDIRELEFMNSSCLKDMVFWLSTVRDSPPEQRYHIVFLSNPGYHWQKRSLHSLTCFATDFVNVQSEPAHPAPHR